MKDSTNPTNDHAPESPRARAGTWARPVDRLKAGNIQADININVDGKRLAGPLRGSIGFARSSAGEYTFSIFSVVAISLIVSWLVAVIFAPLIGKTLLKPPKKQETEPKPGKLVLAYTALLQGAIRMKWVTIGVTLAAFAAAVVLSGQVSRQIFPASDRPELTVNLTLRQNASIFATESEVKRLEEILKADPDVDHFSSYVGRGAIRFTLTLDVQLANPFFGQFVVVAKDLEARERLHDKLEKVLAEQCHMGLPHSLDKFRDIVALVPAQGRAWFPHRAS